MVAIINLQALSWESYANFNMHKHDSGIGMLAMVEVSALTDSFHY